LFIVAGLPESLGVTNQKVSQKCNISEAPTFLEVCLSPYIIFVVTVIHYHRFVFTLLTLTFYIILRFNGHLRKKGISGLIKVNYEQKTLMIEVKLLLFVIYVSVQYTLLPLHSFQISNTFILINFSVKFNL